MWVLYITQSLFFTYLIYLQTTKSHDITQMKEGRANCVDIREGNVPAGRKRLLCKGPEATAWLVCRRDSKVWLEQMEQRGEQQE